MRHGGELWSGRWLVGLLAVLTIGPLTALAGSAVVLGSSGVTEQVKETLEVTAALSALGVEQQMAGVADVVTATARRPGVAAAFEGGAPGSRAQPVLDEDLRQLVHLRKGLVAAYAAGPDGRVVATVPEMPELEGTDLSADDWFRGVAGGGKTYVSQAFLFPAGDNPRVVSVAAPVAARRADGTVGPLLGVIAVALETDTVQSFAEGLEGGRELALTIADQAGTAVASPLGLPEGLTTVRSPLMREALAGRFGLVEEEGERPSLAAYAPVRGLGWGVVVQVERRSALAGAAVLRRAVRTIAAALALILVGGLVVLDRALYLRRRAEEQVRRLARCDQLTGLPNRRVWDEDLELEVARARRTGDGFCVAMLDLDRFKAYNDEFGHQRGDRLLADAAACWSQALRDVDLLARYGGEEFGVLLPGCALPEAMAVVDRLRHLVPEGRTVSGGVAEWNGSESGVELLGRADAALYLAKRRRNRVVAAADTQPDLVLRGGRRQPA